MSNKRSNRNEDILSENNKISENLKSIKIKPFRPILNNKSEFIGKLERIKK